MATNALAIRMVGVRTYLKRFFALNPLLLFVGLLELLQEATKFITFSFRLFGNISAGEEVTLLHTGKVLGNITTPKLVVEPGVITEGKVTITSGQSEDAKKIIEESFGPEPEEAFSAVLRERKRERAREKDREEPGK